MPRNSSFNLQCVICFITMITQAGEHDLPFYFISDLIKTEFKYMQRPVRQ